MIEVFREKQYIKQADSYAWQMAEQLAKVGQEQQCLLWKSLEESAERSFECFNFPWANSSDCFQAFQQASLPQLEQLLRAVNARLKNVSIGGDSQTYFWAIKDFLDAHLFASRPERGGECQDECLRVLEQVREQTLKRILGPLIPNLPRPSKNKAVQTLFAAFVSRENIVDAAKSCSDEALKGVSETFKARIQNEDDAPDKAEVKLLTLMGKLVNSVIIESTLR